MNEYEVTKLNLVNNEDIRREKAKGNANCKDKTGERWAMCFLRMIEVASSELLWDDWDQKKK